MEISTNIKDYIDALLNLGIKEEYSYVKKQQIKNTNLTALIAFLFGSLSTLATISIVPIPYIFIPLTGCLLYLMSLPLNYFQKHELANLCTWMITNIIFFWLANAYGRESNAYLLFIIAEMVSIFNFDLKNNRSLIWIIALPLVGAVITFVTQFSLLTPIISLTQRLNLSSIMFFISMIGSAIAVWVYRIHLHTHIRNLEETQAILQKQNAELEGMNDELVKTNEELDRFVYSVSHDLRAPITSVMGLLDLCENDEENVKTYLQLQRKSMNKLDAFIKDILHYARNSRLPVTPVTLDFEQNIKEVFEDQCHAQLAKELDFQIKVEGNANVFIDEFRFKIIVANLISNAIRYRKMNIQNSYIHCNISLNEKYAKIEMIDNGIGIPAKYLPNIFQMFYRANSKSTGSGLGLYIVKEALNKMKGSIEVTSEEGIGTTFTVIIPNLEPIRLLTAAPKLAKIA